MKLRLLICAVCTCILFSSFSSAEERVNKSVTNMYEHASEASSVVSQAKYAEKVTVLKEDSEWLFVRSNDQYEGWILRDNVAQMDDYFEESQMITTLSRETLIYSSDSVGKHKPLLKLPFGVELTAMDDPNKWGSRWIRIRLLDGGVGWVQRGDIHIGSLELDMTEMVKLSKLFIGVPYTWGGRSSLGFDCSGFVQEMYKTIGVHLPRDSGPQSRWSGLVDVPKSSLKPGDLLFFGNQKVSHVGLFLQENEEGLLFINATVSDNNGSNAPYLQISNLNSDFWSGLFIEAKRLK